MREEYYLYNLIEDNISYSLIRYIINNLSIEDITYEVLFPLIKDIDLTTFFIMSYKKIDKSKKSAYILCHYDIDFLIVDKIFGKYKSLESINQRLNEVVIEFKLDEKNKRRVIQCLQECINFDTNNTSNINLRIFIIEILKKSSKPLTHSEIWKELYESNIRFQLKFIHETLQELFNLGVIKFTIDGYYLDQPEICEVINGLTSERKRKINSYLYSNKNLNDFSSNEIRELKSITEIMPHYKSEELERKKYANFELRTNFIREFLTKEESINYRYISLKYKDIQNSSKSELNFLLESNLLDSEENKKKYLRLLKNDDLENYYIEIVNHFNNYLLVNNIFLVNDEIISEFINNLPDTSILKMIFYNSIIKATIYRRLNESDEVFKLKSNKIYLTSYIPESINIIITSFLENIDGLFSAQYLFRNNIEIFSRFEIHDGYKLFRFIETFFASKYPKLIFFDNEFIEPMNYDKNQFIRTLVDICQPIKISQFIKEVFELTGVKRDKFLTYSEGVLNNFVVGDMIYLEEYDLSFEESELLKTLCGDYIISIENLKKLVSKTYSNFDVLVRPSILKRIGFSLSDKFYINNRYNNYLEAFANLVDSLPRSFEEERITNYIEKNVFVSKFRGFFMNLNIIYDDNRYILNLKKIVGEERIITFRNELIDSIDNEQIFSIKSIYNQIKPSQVLSKYTDILTLSDNILSKILETSPSIQKSNAKTLVYRKGKPVSIIDLFYEEIKKNKEVSILDLKEIILRDYGLSIEVNIMKLKKYGIYYSEFTEMIYLNREYYNKKVSDYLND